jgi:hypothetical protein
VSVHDDFSGKPKNEDRRKKNKEACISNDSTLTSRKVLVSSLKGEVKKKHHSNGWIFSCFAAHLFEQDLF